MDLDLARPRGLAPLHLDLHDAVDVLRLHPLGVDVLGKADDPAELAGETLLAIKVRLPLFPELPLARHCEQVLLDRDFQALGVDTGREEVDVHPLRRLADVDGGEAASGQRPDAQWGTPAAEKLVDLLLQPPKLVKDRARRIRGNTEHKSTSYRFNEPLGRTETYGWAAEIQEPPGGVAGTLRSELALIRTDLGKGFDL